MNHRDTERTEKRGKKLEDSLLLLLARVTPFPCCYSQNSPFSFSLLAFSVFSLSLWFIPLFAFQLGIAQVGDEHMARLVGNQERRPRLHRHGLRGDAAGPEDRHLAG